MNSISFKKLSGVQLPHYFFLEDQLAELQTGEDVAIIFEEGNFLQENLDKQLFKEVLQTIGRNDLANKLEIYIAAGKRW